MHTTDPTYTLLEQHICPGLDDVLRLGALTQIERRTIRRCLEMLEEALGDVQDREREQTGDVCDHDHSGA